MTSLWAELSSPSYFEIAVPNDPQRSSPPDAKVEVAVGLGSFYKPLESPITPSGLKGRAGLL